jgi:hypothetical protein
MIERKVNIVFLVGIFLSISFSIVSIAGTVEKSNTPYAILLFSVIFALITLIIFRKFPNIIKVNSYKKGDTFFEKLLVKYLSIGWLFILIAWLIGVTNAIYLDVNPSYVFRNFFGMLLYGLIPILFILSIPARYIYNAIIFAAIFQILYLMSFMPKIYLYSNMLESLSSLRVVHNPAAIVIYPLLSLSLAFLFYPKSLFSRGRCTNYFNFLNSKITLFVIIVAIIVPGASKGHFLATVFIIFCSWLMAVIDAVRAKKNKLLIFGLLFFVAIVLLIPDSFLFQLSYTFGSEEASNSIRSEQASFLIREFSLFGSGLGSSLESGYVRDNTGYGFELSYLNIIHKLGVFSMALFLYYLSTVILIVYRILHRKHLISSYFCFGLMAYLIIGAGNPLLLSSTAITLHVIAVYILLFPLNIGVYPAMKNKSKICAE